jgi:phosphonatase-like hydrolase
MEIDLIVLDMAGTTVNDDDSVNVCLREALSAVGVRPSRDEINTVMGMPKPVAIQALLAQFRGHAAATTVTVERVHDDFMRRMLWHYESHPDVRECDGATELLAWCRSRGIKTALDTGFNRVIADAVITRLGWRHRALLDATIASDEVPRGRPHPDMIHRAMALTGVGDPRRVMKVGDTPADIAEGRGARCRYVVAITSGSHSEAELQIHGPTHLVSTLGAIRRILAAGEVDAA